jgi:hypothetical protein
MRKLMMLGLALVLAAGCKKVPSGATGGSSNTSSGGLVGAIHQKVKGSISQQQMDQLFKYLFAMSTERSNSLPSEQEIKAELQRDARQLWKLIQDGDVVLTGTRSPKGIWAYTKAPQTADGGHWVITEGGVTSMSKEAIDKQRQ